MEKKVTLDLMEVTPLSEEGPEEEREGEKGEEKGKTVINRFYLLWVALGIVLFLLVLGVFSLVPFWHGGKEKTVVERAVPLGKGREKVVHKESKTVPGGFPILSLPKKEIFIALPEFIVPLRDSKNRETLALIALSLEVDEANKTYVEENIVYLRNLIYEIIKNEAKEVLLGGKGMSHLKRSLLEGANDYFGKEIIKNLFFDEYLLL